MDTLFDKVKLEETRVNRELNEHARNRIIKSFSFQKETMADSIRELSGKVGEKRLPEYPTTESYRQMKKYKSKARDAHKDIINGCDTIIVFSYLQILEEKGGPYDPNLEELIEGLEGILSTENILWEVQDKDSLSFSKMVSEEMEASNKRVRDNFREGDFQKSMQAYNGAWRMFSDEEFTYRIPEKLYNSIEEILKEICVEKEGWLDSKEQSHKKYLDKLSEHDVFYPNNIMREEMKDMMDSMEKFVSKAGKERKNQHSNIDEEYSRLLIHQTAAYLDFIITRYQSGDYRD